MRRHDEGNPVRVALVGTGFMGRGIALQIATSIRGMQLVAISARNAEQGRTVFKEAGISPVRLASSVPEVEEAIASGVAVVAEDPSYLCEAGGIDAVVDATGDVEFGARVAIEAIQGGKHIVLMNAELDATLGPVLKVRADTAGVIMTNTDGDEPGVAMNLVRYMRSIGFRVVLAGNLKGLYDRYRTPHTQRKFAERVGQKPHMVTSFIDGTKLSMELSVLANATGLGAGRRGLYGPNCAHVNDCLKAFPLEQLLDKGWVDFLVGAEPGTGVFAVGHSDDAVKSQYLHYFKMGQGPYYVFYTPFHLPNFQLPLSVARAVLFHDPTVTPAGAPVCEVATFAKQDLRAGQILDGIGGFHCYGLVENADVFHAEGLLPMGISKGCRLHLDIPKDGVVRYADVELPSGRLCDRLRQEQDALFWKGSITPESEGACRR